MPDQTSVYLRKWFLQAEVELFPDPVAGWATNLTRSGQPKRVASIDSDLFCLWMLQVPDEAATIQPLGSWRITVVRRLSDGALCFLLNDGRYVGFQSGYLTLVADLSSAEGFSFLMMGDDEPFDFKLDLDTRGAHWQDRWSTVLTPIGSTSHSGLQLTASDEALVCRETPGLTFQAWLITPPLEAILTLKNGDGLDLSGVDFTAVDFSSCSLREPISRAAI